MEDREDTAQPDTPISAGPFSRIPFELQQHLCGTCPVPRQRQQDVEDGAVRWLLGELQDAGIPIAWYDREVVRVIAEEGTSLVQVVAGWVARARKV